MLPVEAGLYFFPQMVQFTSISHRFPQTKFQQMEMRKQDVNETKKKVEKLFRDISPQRWSIISRTGECRMLDSKRSYLRHLIRGDVTRIVHRSLFAEGFTTEELINVIQIPRHRTFGRVNFEDILGPNFHLANVENMTAGSSQPNVEGQKMNRFARTDAATAPTEGDYAEEKS